MRASGVLVSGLNEHQILLFDSIVLG
jgi:hypothetical protein